MDRKEHLDWCKGRALAYVDACDIENAFTSMMSDLGKHEETKAHLAIELGMMLLLGGELSTVNEMRKFIEGFN